MGLIDKLKDLRSKFSFRPKHLAVAAPVLAASVASTLPGCGYVIPVSKTIPVHLNLPNQDSDTIYIVNLQDEDNGVYFKIDGGNKERINIPNEHGDHIEIEDKGLKQDTSSTSLDFKVKYFPTKDPSRNETSTIYRATIMPNGGYRLEVMGNKRKRRPTRILAPMGRTGRQNRITNRDILFSKL
ncbi:MAG: hypothetical protein JSW08_00655 [archaeon]|nr:MAG: hypothetical protein JSW08_00655 [archaeon]